MSRRGARLTIAVLFALVCAAATWQYLRVERALASQTGEAATFEREARTLATAIVDLRAAQQAYVAAGQGLDYWTTHVTRSIASLHARLDLLRQHGASTEAVSRVLAASTALDDFSRMDGRAREYATNDQRLLASDLIFGDGVEMTRSIAAEVDEARSAEAAFRADAARQLRGQQQLLAGGVAGLGLLFLLIVAVLAPGPSPNATAVEAATAHVLDLAPEHPHREHGANDLSDASILEFRPSAPAPAPVNLTAAAELCVDLARVRDTEEIPALLERTTRVLDARGIVLWMADPEARELVPTVAHGYPAASLARLGSIPREADNATAAAFREERVHTVRGDMLTNGAIVAPLVTTAGCVGVMAVEVRHEREQREEVRAVASILASQLATLIGVAPVAQPQAKAN